MSVSSKANFFNRPRYSTYTREAFIYYTNLLWRYKEPYKERRLACLSYCQREGYCQRQMDIQWATRVAYSDAYDIPTCFPHEKKKTSRCGPFVLRRTGRSASLKNACATSALLLTSPRRSKWISAGRLEHESRLLSTRSNLARNASKGYRKAKCKA